jgi:hypothetical protein
MADDPDQPGAGEPARMPKRVVMPPLPTREPPVGLKPCPPVGVYPGMSFDEYITLDALNHSPLRKIKKSPRKFRKARDYPRDKKTPSKALGTAAHLMLLEPDKFKGNIIPPPMHDKGKYMGKFYTPTSDAFKEYATDHPDKIVLHPDEVQVLAIIGEEARKNTRAHKLLTTEGLNEVVLIWDDPSTGARCKARCDRAIPAYGIVDVKTTRDEADPSDFARTLVKHSYGTQAAFYLRGVRALKEAGIIDWKEAFSFIVAETEDEDEDYGVTVINLMEKTLIASDALVSQWLAIFKACTDANLWPSYPDVQECEAPAYFFRQFEDAEN